MSQKLVLVPLAVVSNLALLYITIQFAPEEGDGGRLSFPSSLEDIRSLSVLLNNYSRNNPIYVLVLFSMAYLFKQTFAVPGSVFLNDLSNRAKGAEELYFTNFIDKIKMAWYAVLIINFH